MIFRIEKREKYVVLDKGFLESQALSLKAKGLLALMLSRPNDWKFSEMELAKTSHDGIKSVRSAIKELIKLGYIERKQLKDGNKFAGYEYVVREFPLCRFGITQNRKMQNGTLLSNKELSNELPKHEEYNPEAQNPRSGASQGIDEVDEFVDSYYPSLYEEAYGCQHPPLTPVQRRRTKQIIRDYLRINDSNEISDIESAADCFINRTSTDGDIRALATPDTLDRMIPQAMSEGYR